MNNRRSVVLIVEDDANDQAFIRMALQKAGPEARIQVVNNGEEAIACLMGERGFSDRSLHPYPDFVITDLKMPILDGFAVLEHLKANPAWAVIPVVVLSASADPDDVRTAYLLGASSYHTKPLGFEALCVQLQTLYEYWMTCQVPEVDGTGRQVLTLSRGRMGERYPQPLQTYQERVAASPPPSASI